MKEKKFSKNVAKGKITKNVVKGKITKNVVKWKITKDVAKGKMTKIVAKGFGNKFSKNVGKENISLKCSKRNNIPHKNAATERKFSKNVTTGRNILQQCSKSKKSL